MVYPEFNSIKKAMNCDQKYLNLPILELCYHYSCQLYSKYTQEQKEQSHCNLHVILMTIMLYQQNHDTYNKLISSLSQSITLRDSSK